MNDRDCIAFLQWCLPRLRLRWAGFRKVHRTVCKRLGRRLRELGLEDLDAYRARLEETPAEWSRLDAMCRIPISRFYRDRSVFEALRREVLPALEAAALARGARVVRCWSAGCASGEEAYSLNIAWREREPPAAPCRLSILATDIDETMIGRAEIGCYREGSLKDLPRAWLDKYFTRRDGLLCVRAALKQDISFRLQDMRTEWPDGMFDLVMCRNGALTYFEPSLQAFVFSQIERRLRTGGFLVIGSHEKLPPEADRYVAVGNGVPIYRRS